MADGDENQNDLRVPEPLFNIAHLLKYIELIPSRAWAQLVPALGPLLGSSGGEFRHAGY